VAFTCHFAVPVTVGDGRSITLATATATATHRNVGVAVHLLLLAALGLTAAVRPAVGARIVALGVVGLPWLAGTVDRLWAPGEAGAVRGFAAAVLVGLVAVAVAVGAREVRWSAGGVLLGDGMAIIGAGATLFGLLGVNWYRVRGVTRNALFEPRFGVSAGHLPRRRPRVWAAGAVAVAAIAIAVVGGGWGRRVAGVGVAGLCTFEAARRTFLTGSG
jgi:hypothetical protein